MTEVAIAELTVNGSTKVISRRRLRQLLAAHMLLPLVIPLLALAQPHVPTFVWQWVWLLMVYQVFLVSVWAGLVTNTPWRKALILVGGTAYICVSWYLVQRGSRFDWDAASYVATAFAWYLLVGSVSAGLLWIIRISFFDLRWVPQPEVVDAHYRNQLGIRHLLALTFVCGLLIAATRLPERLVGPWWPIGLFAVLIAAMIFAAIWSALTPGRVMGRLALTMLAAIGIVVLTSVQFDTSIWETMSLLPGFVLAVLSLLVVRSAGYRLLRHVA